MHALTVIRRRRRRGRGRGETGCVDEPGIPPHAHAAADVWSAGTHSRIHSTRRDETRRAAGIEGPADPARLVQYGTVCGLDGMRFGSRCVHTVHTPCRRSEQAAPHTGPLLDHSTQVQSSLCALCIAGRMMLMMLMMLREDWRWWATARWGRVQSTTTSLNNNLRPCYPLDKQGYRAHAKRRTRLPPHAGADPAGRGNAEVDTSTPTHSLPAPNR